MVNTPQDGTETSEGREELRRRRRTPHWRMGVAKEGADEAAAAAAAAGKDSSEEEEL